MAVAIVQEAHNFSATMPVTVTMAGNFTEGSLILAWVMENTANVVQAPNGSWTAVTSSLVSHANATLDGQWFYRTAGAGEGSTVVCDSTGSTGVGCQVYELSGAGTPGTAATSTATGATTLASGSVTGSSGGLVLAGFAPQTLPGASQTYSNSYVNDVNANVRIQAAHLAGAGASTSTTITTSNATDKISSIFDVPQAATVIAPHSGFPRGIRRGIRK